jgi:hypothetical protein
MNKEQIKKAVEAKKRLEEEVKSKLEDQKGHFQKLGKGEGDYYEKAYEDLIDKIPTDEELLADVEMFGPKIKVRTIAELVEEATKNLKDSFSNLKFAFCPSEKFVLKDDEKDLEQINEKIKMAPEDFRKLIFDFAFIYGNYNQQKKWIKIGTSPNYIAFPSLLQNGKHSTFVLSEISGISERLRKVDNAFIKILAKSKIVLKPEQRPYAFSKGHLLNEEKRKDILDDINLVFSQLKIQVDKRNFSSLKFFGK